MAHSCTSALVIAGPSPLREGLQALLIAMPQIEVVEGADDTPSALDMSFESHPTLVVVDGDVVNAETWLALRRVKARWPQARYILLANDVQQQQEAEAAGADAALLKGTSMARLTATIVRLVSQQERQVGKDDVVVSLSLRESAGWGSRSQRRLVL